MVFSSEDRVAANCDLCGGKPECVAVCPTGVLKLDEINMEKLTLSERVKAIYEAAPVFDFVKLMSINERRLLVYRSKREVQKKGR
jgi:Fe-S-cluster-containing dehydrogenase component